MVGTNTIGSVFLIFLVAVLSPRLALALTWLFSPWVDRAFGTAFWPILGIIFLPLTTLAYVILWNTNGFGVDGWEWLVVGLALIWDAATHGGGLFARRR